MADARRALPSVDRVLTAFHDGVADRYSAPVAAAAVRAVLVRAREHVTRGGATPSLDELLVTARLEAARAARPSLRRVINATGVILQTNLGRAPLSDRAITAMAEVAAGYTNLEFDLASGERGSRHDHVRELLVATTGADDAIVVNNNAAALLMVLQVFAAGREVIVSRGQAVEIGGGFRIPDVLRQSGAFLSEVGTTNRTYARDYEAAWNDNTAAILRVHTSNFKVVGFTSEASLVEMAAVARGRGGMLIDDIGSGCIVDTSTYGIAREPTVQDSLAAGADLVLFSGDKLLGGPQCGVVAGRSDLVTQLRQHPLARALRVDKLTLAALDVTLRAYRDGTEARDIPVWRMLGGNLAVIKRRARKWAAAAGTAGTVVASKSMVGGGSLPGEGVPTWCTAFALRHPGDIANALRQLDPAIVGRIEDGLLLLDPRTVDARDDRFVAASLQALIPGAE